MAITVPEAVRSAAQARLKRTAIDQALVEDAIRRKRPLQAEGERERSLGYIERLVGVDRALAERIAAYEDPRKLPITPVQATAAESIQGNTVDFLPISFLELARAGALSVARVALRSRRPVGTGFMISPSLFLTNQHVIPEAAAAKGMAAEFRFEHDPHGKDVPVTRFAFDPDRFFLASPEKDFDFALVAVGERIEGAQSLSDFGFLPLSGEANKHILGGFVNIVQHPDGRQKEVVIRENHIFARTENTLIYGADTLPGASGSVVVNDLWEPVALHHYGSPYRARRDEDVKDVPAVGNEGIRVSSIVKHLRGETAGLTASARTLLEAALNCAFSMPSLAHTTAGEARVPAGAVDDRVSPRSSVFIGSDGSATWQIPLTVSVRVGGEPQPAPAVTPSPASIEAKPPQQELPRSDAEAMPKPDPNYESRPGYNPDFLGIRVEAPRLSAAQKKIAASHEGPDGRTSEIAYQHFSVVMNSKRRLPFFTAVNIDGASVVRIDRDTGDIKSVERPESAEGYERWYIDPRIGEDEQCDQSLYSSAPLKDFQRGHLVKRTDPSWGTGKRGLLGQADTFHFTNCAPQHRLFNPIATRWAGIENWITGTSDNEDLRVTVFSGCVFRDDDPQYGYIRVPRDFWKVVVWTDNGALRALAVVANQSQLFEAKRRKEGLDEFPQKLPPEYQWSIADLEKLVKLDLGPLRQYDVFAGEKRRAVKRFEDVRIAATSRPKRQRSRKAKR